MDGNPYARIVALMQSGAGREAPEGEHSGLGALPVRMRIGKVVRRVPLEVEVAGIRQPTEGLRINERLVKDAKWKVKLKSPKSDYRQLTGQLAGPVDCPGGQGSPRLGEVTGGQIHSGDTLIDEGEVTQLEIDLEVGDKVLLLTEDDQIFYIVMKVVAAV